MEHLNQPSLSAVEKGKLLKTFLIGGKRGANIPLHYCTNEVAVIVQKGLASLTMEGDRYLLQEGKVMIIPSAATHSLQIFEDFEAVIVMPVDASIEFSID